MSQDSLKQLAALEALNYVKDGMRLGVGTGSTINFFIKALAERVAAGLKIIAVPTSSRTEDLCKQYGIALSSLNDTPKLDLTIDGADEVSADCQLIKGGGGALLYEKIVAASSKDFIVIVDESKLVDKLGAFPLPIEVNSFGWVATKLSITELAASLNLPTTIELRMVNEQPFVTDGGHYILDAHFKTIDNPIELSDKLLQIAGVVQHGLFINMAKKIIIANSDGTLSTRLNK